MFRIIPSFIPGFCELQTRPLEDHRGRFIKTFHRDIFAEASLNTAWAEEYYSVSRRGVLRGIHFQLPPHDHEKLVYCTQGEVLDAVVDLRVGSPTFGRHALIRLNAEQGNMVYIPRGLAHGFLTLSDSATMMYKVATVYAPDHDAGILWSSAGIDWPENNPVLSDRDRQFPPLAGFRSLFTFSPDEVP